MTFSLMYAFSENYVLPISHDEVVHGKGSLWERMPGDPWNKAANIRALLAFMWAHPGKQLLFMGQEFGQSREWSEQRSLDWESLADPLHGGLKTMVGDMNRAYRAHPALWTKDVSPEGFSWIDANDTAGNVFSFLRHGVDADGRPTVLACIANFSGSAREDYRVGLPFAGRWREVLNTDAEAYGGSGVGNLGAVEAEQHVWHGRPASARLRLPPSGVLWLAPEPFEGAVRRPRAAAVAAAPPAAAGTGPAQDAPAADDAGSGPVAPGGTPLAEALNGSGPGTSAAAVVPAPGTADEVDAGSGPVTLATTPLGGDRDDAGAGPPDPTGSEAAGTDAGPSDTAGPVVEGTGSPVDTAPDSGAPDSGDGATVPAEEPDDAEPELAPSPVDPAAAGAPPAAAPAMPEPEAADTVLDDGPGTPVADGGPAVAPAEPAGDAPTAPPTGRSAQGDGAAATLRDPGAAVTAPRDADSSDTQ
jgi:1,4-alpha-glucan branching enzyme